ncbi:MAG: hypothetical protein R3Y08_00945 [Rikenellaceae bacterium]
MFKYINKKNIATFFLVLMCVQYLPWEGYGVSYIKFTAMCLAPIIWLLTSSKISKAFVWAGLYFVAILFSGLFNLHSFRLSTVGYLLSFIFMFIMYYNLVWVEQIFSLDSFIRLLKKLILAYVICLLMQQAVHLVGIESFPLINTYSSYGRGFLAGNSLAIEPSHSARILTIAFLSLLRMYEVKWGKENVNLKAIYADAKWVLLGFLWSMLTMGSGTAFVGLGILSLYFIKRQYVFTVVPLLVILYFAIPYIEFEPLQRAKVTLEATMTMDADAVIAADGSASVRIVPIINTLTELDLLDSKTWLGHGIDAGATGESMKTIGGIGEYGLLSYICALTLIFTCIIRRFFSLETLLAFALVGLTINNFAYVWGFYMILSTTNYFQNNHNKLNA